MSVTPSSTGEEVWLTEQAYNALGMSSFPITLESPDRTSKITIQQPTSIGSALYSAGYGGAYIAIRGRETIPWLLSVPGKEPLLFVQRRTERNERITGRAAPNRGVLDFPEQKGVSLDAASLLALGLSPTAGPTQAQVTTPAAGQVIEGYIVQAGNQAWLIAETGQAFQRGTAVQIQAEGKTLEAEVSQQEVVVPKPDDLWITQGVSEAVFKQGVTSATLQGVDGRSSMTIASPQRVGSTQLYAVQHSGPPSQLRQGLVLSWLLTPAGQAPVLYQQELLAQGKVPAGTQPPREGVLTRPEQGALPMDQAAAGVLGLTGLRSPMQVQVQVGSATSLPGYIVPEGNRVWLLVQSPQEMRAGIDLQVRAGNQTLEGAISSQGILEAKPDDLWVTQDAYQLLFARGATSVTLQSIDGRSSMTIASPQRVGSTQLYAVQHTGHVAPLRAGAPITWVQNVAGQEPAVYIQRIPERGELVAGAVAPEQGIVDRPAQRSTELNSAALEALGLAGSRSISLARVQVGTASPVDGYIVPDAQRVWLIAESAQELRAGTTLQIEVAGKRLEGEISPQSVLSPKAPLIDTSSLNYCLITQGTSAFFPAAPEYYSPYDTSNASPQGWLRGECSKAPRNCLTFLNGSPQQFTRFLRFNFSDGYDFCWQNTLTDRRQSAWCWGPYGRQGQLSQQKIQDLFDGKTVEIYIWVRAPRPVACIVPVPCNQARQQGLTCK